MMPSCFVHGSGPKRCVGRRRNWRGGNWHHISRNGMDLSIFRQYDIRGVFGENLDGDVAWRIGCAYAQAVTREASLRTRGNSQVAVARDCRQSSDLLADALICGLLAGGSDVVALGMCPTPLLY